MTRTIVPDYSGYDHVSISPVFRNRTRPIDQCLNSELLFLAYTSDVNDPNPAQIERAHQALHLRSKAIAEGWTGRQGPDVASVRDYLRVCREIVSTHIADRHARFGPEQCAPFDEVAQLAAEGRDTFLIIKFMDEEAHIQSTIDSLLAQKGVDCSRIVLIGVDNMSSDRSGEIFRQARDANTGSVHMIYCQQTISGGGSAARYGVDRSIATVLAMCEATGDWGLLHRARIAVSDGDTIYHPHLVADATHVFDTYPDIDGIMPFLIYKLTAALRLFDGYRQSDPAALLKKVEPHAGRFVPVNFALDGMAAQDLLPRRQRIARADGMHLGLADGTKLFVPFVGTTEHAGSFGVLVDAKGNRALIFSDRFLVLERAPVSGYDSALVYLENGRVGRGEVWRWHSLIGHDLFLLWAFRAMNLGRDYILPDTSDALKAFRVWSFAVGGQHQLKRPGTERVTGTDYQSGRVLQTFGARVVLGTPHAHSETEIDRLSKMIRNFANEQSVFYGNTRSRALERASGLYLHMTRIQDEIEAEIRGYSEALYRDVVFPERILFPFRWLLQNFISAYCVADPAQRHLISERTFEVLFPPDRWAKIREEILTEAVLDAMNHRRFEALRSEGEVLAEQIMGAHWTALIEFYEATLRRFFDDHDIDVSTYGFLLEPLADCRNSLLEERPFVNVNDVWSQSDFKIDQVRGQVVAVGARA